MKLLKLAEETHVLIITTHHIVSDRWSIGVFLREIATLYRGFLQGDKSPLKDLPIQYADWSIWQRNKLTGTELNRQIEYWI